MGVIIRNDVLYAPELTMNRMSQAEYDALPDSKNTDGIVRFVNDDTGEYFSAGDISYVNSISGLDADNVQDAIDEVNSQSAKIDDTTSSETTVYSSHKIEAILGALPAPMTYKGTLGTGGTISTLPVASHSNEGFTYAVITDGTYDSQAAKVGDMFISNGTSWTLIPSGDDPVVAQQVTYTNTTSGLTSDNVQGAIDELSAKPIPTASANTLGGIKVGSNLSVLPDGTLSAVDTTDSEDITYDNTTSHLTATNLQAAIDEVVSKRYILPPATTNILGGVKIGSNISVDANGVISASIDSADKLDYDNTTSGLNADNVQEAIDELNNKEIPFASTLSPGIVQVGSNLNINTSTGVLSAVDTKTADGISYDNTDSGLSANDVQEAIDELNDKDIVINDSSASATSVYSSQKIEALLGSLPKSMVYKGTVGTGGTIATLPTASSSNEGFVYLVCSDGTYSSITAKVGDMFISNGSSWALIPSGDDPVLAQSVTYNNAVSGLTATDVQAAIDELVANQYVLPTATASRLGGIKVGTNLSVSSGVLSATDTIRSYFCTCDTAAATATKVVASTDTSLKLEIGTIIVVSFTNSNSASSVKLNVNGTGAKNVRVNDATYTGTSTAYTGYASRQIMYMYDGTGWAWIGKSWDSNTTYSAMTGATAEAAGTAGLVPTPAAGKNESFLRGDATWVVPTDTKNSCGAGSTNNKIYLVGRTDQTTGTSYSHKLCYVGTDHELYSNGTKVVTLFALVTFTTTKAFSCPAGGRVEVTFGTASPATTTIRQYTGIINFTVPNGLILAGMYIDQGGAPGYPVLTYYNPTNSAISIPKGTGMIMSACI